MGLQYIELGVDGGRKSIASDVSKSYYFKEVKVLRRSGPMAVEARKGALVADWGRRREGLGHTCSTAGVVAPFASIIALNWGELSRSAVSRVLAASPRIAGRRKKKIACKEPGPEHF